MAPPQPQPPIGTATMLADGTLVLDLIADDGKGTRGVGQLRYPMDHAQYLYILNHVSPIGPGDKVPVKPFPPPPPPAPPKKK
jgi:hypothetical protein